MKDETRPRIGVSACLLGSEVRFDGGHARDRYVTDVLSEHVDFVPVCPEMEAGLGAPRPTMRLVRGRAAEGLRVLSSHAAGDAAPTDHTARLDTAVARRVNDGSLDDVCGLVLKKNSPSCGPHRVKVYLDNGVTAPSDPESRGVFAAAVHTRWPHLPIEDEGRLNDPGLRESFLLRVFAWHRYRALRAGELTRRALREFHARHKMLLHAHEPHATRGLGRLVSNVDNSPEAVVHDADLYAAEMMRILSKPASRGRHVDTLQHLAGHLGGALPPAARTELQSLVEEYRKGWIALETPLTLLRHHLRALGTDWSNTQLYLDPHPRALGLRSVVR